MIDLSSEPSLGSMILTRDGVLKYSYVLPRGMTFPSDAEGLIRFTDRAGGEYEFSPHEGELSDDLTKMEWLIDPQILNHVPAGANFEVYVTYEDNTYKVRYGRVVRREAEYPLSPFAVDAPPLMYEDDLQRNMPGPRWVAKAGAVSMHGVSGVTDLSQGTGYAMASRNAVDIFGLGLNLFQAAAAMWYAPTQSDTVEMSVGLVDGQDGFCTVVFGSNYAMNSFVGVKFTDPGWGGTPTDTIQVVTGTAWNQLTEVGSPAAYDMPTAGGKYKITYSPSAGVSVYVPGSSTPILTQSVANAGVLSGPGYRYTGAIWQGSFVTTGPKIYYWKVKDAV